MSWSSILNPIVYDILCFSQLNGGSFGPDPRKQDSDYLTDLKFGTCNYCYKTIKNTKFHNIGCSIFGDIKGHKGHKKFVSSCRNKSSRSDIYPSKMSLMMPK